MTQTEIERSTVKRPVPLYLAGAALGLLAAAGAWRGSSNAPGGVRQERPRISAEALRRPLPGRWAPRPPFIRSIEVTRPSSLELTVLAAAPRQAPVDVEEPPPVCEPPPRALLRAGCPEAPPQVGSCSVEGLECRYATSDACTAEYECLFGSWSPVGVDCPDGEPGQLLSGSGQCEANTPVADAPCADEGLSCGHQPCGIGGYTQVIAECRCGRWYQRWQQCPLTR